MNTERSGMSLQDVYDKLRAAENGANGPTLWPGDCGDMADTIDAHLSRDAVVSDEPQGDFAECYISERGLEQLRSDEGFTIAFRVKSKSSAIPLFINIDERHAAVPDAYVIDAAWIEAFESDFESWPASSHYLAGRLRKAVDMLKAHNVGEIILEHSGCGQGCQANQLTVSLYPGDKVFMVRGRMGKAMLAQRDGG